MRLTNIVAEESVKGDLGRSQKISFEQAKETIHSRCKQAVDRYKRGYGIYRGVFKDEEAFLTDPSTVVRKSRNTQNHFTLLTSEILPSWDRFPRRNKSLICSSVNFKAANYGRLYAVFPYDNADIGVSSGSDVWYSFPLLRTKMMIRHVHDLNQTLEEISELLGIKLESKADFEKFDEMMSDIAEGTYTFKFSHRYMDSFAKVMHENGGLLKGLDKILDPKKNGFELQKISNYSADSADSGDGWGKGKEVWTDSKCVLVNGHNKNMDEWMGELLS